MFQFRKCINAIIFSNIYDIHAFLAIYPPFLSDFFYTSPTFAQIVGCHCLELGPVFWRRFKGQTEE